MAKPGIGKMTYTGMRCAFGNGDLRRGRQIMEIVALRLADRTTYNPDFYLMLPDGSIGFHETKGFWRDDARAKIKMAAEQFPEWFFVAVQWDSKAKEWRFERFGRGGK